MAEQRHEERAHSVLGASSYFRWKNCPGSVKAQEGYPDTSTEAADKGTAAHELGEWCLRNDADPVDYPHEEIEVKGRKFKVEDLADKVRVFVEHVSELMVGADKVLLEQKFSLSTVHPDLFGTADVVIVAGNKLHVVDYKNGYIKVDVENNVQLMYYGLGAYLSLPTEISAKIEDVELTIVQPEHWPQVKSWSFSAFELIEFATELHHDAKAALADGAPRAPGAWCKWCKAGGDCKERRDAELSVFDVIVDEATGDVALPAVETITLDSARLGNLYRQLPRIRALLDDIEAHVKEAAKHEDPKAMGLKWVHGTKSHRKWAEDDKTTAAGLIALGLSEDEIYKDRPLKSPAQIEALPQIKAAMKKPRGKPRPKSPIKDFYLEGQPSELLVPLDDEREAVTAPADLFPLLENEASE